MTITLADFPLVEGICIDTSNPCAHAKQRLADLESSARVLRKWAMVTQKASKGQGKQGAFEVANMMGYAVTEVSVIADELDAVVKELRG